MSEEQEKAVIERRALYRRVFNSEDGRHVLRELCYTFKHSAPCFEDDFNSHRAAQRDGNRQVINHILKNSAPTSAESHES